MMFQFMLRDVSQMQPGAKYRYYDYAAKVIVKMLLRLMKKLKLKTIDNVDFETISQHLKTQLKLLLEFYAPDSLSIPNCMRGMSHLVFNQPLQHEPYTNMNQQCTMMKFTNTDQPVRCGNIPTNSISNPMCMLHFPLFDWLGKKITALSSNRHIPTTSIQSNENPEQTKIKETENAKQILIRAACFFSWLYAIVLLQPEDMYYVQTKNAFEKMVACLNADNGIVKYNKDGIDDEDDENDRDPYPE